MGYRILIRYERGQAEMSVGRFTEELTNTLLRSSPEPTHENILSRIEWIKEDIETIVRYMKKYRVKEISIHKYDMDYLEHGSRDEKEEVIDTIFDLAWTIDSYLSGEYVQDVNVISIFYNVILTKDRIEVDHATVWDDA